MRRSLLVWLAAPIVLLACGDDPQVGPPPLVGGSGGDGGAGDTGGVAELPPGEPIEIDISEWRLTGVFSASNDPVYPALEQGTFEQPGATQYLTQAWQPVTPGENGELIEFQSALIYAAATVELKEGERLFARADTVATMFANNTVRQPGDFYASKKMRMPLGGHAGDNLIVVRALGRRGVPEVEIFKSKAELVFNPSDTTLPDFVVGSDTPQYLGIAVLNLSAEAERNVTARVVESDAFVATELSYPSLSANATTQVSFLLVPKGPMQASEEPLRVTLQLTGGTLEWPYETSVEVSTVADGARYRRTRLSQVDGSTQYYAVMPPSGPVPSDGYGLILSLHGAGVEASGQAASYSPKAWAYLVAATNRRPFGFDWEEWGRLDAIETLDDALENFDIDEGRVHLTGHSMGGHGTWNVGVHNSGRFGVIAPSAGWISFETYGGSPHPDGPIGRARASSQTLEYIDNFAGNSVYIIHGSADDNVPVNQARTMFDELGLIVDDLTYHEQAGARHWWDLDADEEGADCVDWEPMIDVMEATTADPFPLEFSIRRSSPWINPRHSYITVTSSITPLEDFTMASTKAGPVLTLDTNNVRSFVIDTQALLDRSITSLEVDGTAVPLSGDMETVGPATGKTPEQQGPLNQVFHKPFCFVWPDEGAEAYRHYAAFLTSWWGVIGNGHACGVPLSQLTDAIATNLNLVFLGVPMDQLPDAPPPMQWSDTGVVANDKAFADSAIALVYPHEDRMRAYLHAPLGKEHLMFRYVPFSSRSGMPDFFIWDEDGVAASGFFSATWKPSLGYSEGLD